MRHLSNHVSLFISWLASISNQLPMGFVTSTEIAYADWPEAARHPQPWKPGKLHLN